MGVLGVLSITRPIGYMQDMRTALALALFFATAFFALGVTQPLIRVDRLFVFSDEPSLVEMVKGLWDGGDLALALIVTLFSIVAPAAKLMLLHVAVADGHDGRLPRWFHALANWSMLDVILVALVIFATKTSGLATAITKPGLWFFAASVVLTATISAMVRRKTA